ncbi:MAG: HAMP domain-containing protein [Treponema sp.]|nr:HAMP domain-containing protein [Treponema sp.]
MKFFHSLEFRILAISIGIIILSNVFLTFISLNLSLSANQESVEALLDAVSDSAAGKIKGETEKQIRMLETLARSEFLTDSNISLREKCAMLSKYAGVNKEYENIGFYDLAGNSYTADGRKIQLQRVYIDNAKIGKNTIMNPAINPVTNILFQIYAVPVYDGNKIIGCLTANVLGESLSEKIAQLTFGKSDSMVMVIDRESGKIVASQQIEDVQNENNLSSYTNPSNEAVLNRMLAGETGNDSFIEEATGVRRIVAFRPVPGINWAVLGLCDYDDFYGHIDQMKIFISILSVVILLVSVIAIGATVHLGLSSLSKLKAAIEEIASGEADLTKRIDHKAKDEIGDVVKGFNKFVDRLQEIMTNIKGTKEGLSLEDENLEAATQDASACITQISANIESVNTQISSQANSVTETAGAVNEIASNIESLEHMIESQASGITQASSAVEEMIGNINSVNSAVDKMVSSFNLLESNTNTGINTLSNANEKIKQIEDESNMLQDANTAIANIAEQTNLLAMNAAIEAAHAGEAGKGFSVVADEIRKLSETSSSQSRTIGEELKKIQETIASVVIAAGDTTAAFGSVSTSIDDTSNIIQQIKAAMEEQQIGSKQIIDALQSMNNSTAEVKAASQEMLEGNKQILKEVELLKESSAIMTDSMNEMSAGALKMNETGAALATISNKVTDSIKEIGDEIDKFVV